MIVDRAYGDIIPETHIMVEVTPETLRIMATRLEELAKSTARNKILTMRLTREITLAYQIDKQELPYGYMVVSGHDL